MWLISPIDQVAYKKQKRDSSDDMYPAIVGIPKHSALEKVLNYFWKNECHEQCSKIIGTT